MSDFDEMVSWSRDLLQGEKVRLREQRPEDLSILAEWWNEPEVALFQQDRIVRRPRTAVEEKLSAWSGNGDSSSVAYAVTTHDGEVAGHVAVHGITPPALIATLGIMMGPPYQNGGYGREAVLLALRLAFLEMGARKMELEVYSFNERAVRVYEQLGFTVEGRRRNAVVHRGAFCDQLLMGMLDAEYYEQYGRG